MKRIIKAIRHIYLCYLWYWPFSVNQSYMSELYDDKEEWYNKALTHLGYGDGWAPEGYPLRMMINGRIKETNYQFYQIVLTHIWLQEMCKIEFKQLAPLTDPKLIEGFFKRKETIDQYMLMWYDDLNGLKRRK